MEKKYITLAQFLKFNNIITTGGEAKFFLINNIIYINGKIDNRKGKKLYNNDVVIINNTSYIVNINNNEN